MVVSSLTSINTLLAGLGAGASMGFAVKMAADAEETQSKFEAVFKNLTGDAETFASDFANRIGRSTVETKRQLAEFQDTFVPLGFARDQAASLSKQMTTLTADLASFNNIADSDAQARLTSGLIGNHEALLKFGTVITAATLDQELMNMGIAKGAKAATQQQKVMARLNLIMKATSDAQGDAERTAGSFTNRLKGFKGAIQDTAAAIGSAFLPALAGILKKGTDSLRGIIPAIQEWAANMAAWGQVVVDNWDTAWALIKTTVRVAWETIKGVFMQYPRIWGFVWGSLVRIAVEMGKKILEIVLELAKNIPRILMSFARGGASAAKAAFNQVVEGLARGLEGDKFSDVFEVTPGMRAALDEQQRLFEKLRAAKNEILDASGKPTKIQAEGAMKIDNATVKKLEIPTGTFGFEDFVDEMQKQLFKANDPQEKMAGLMEADKLVQQRQTGILERIAENTEKQGGLKVAPV